MKNNSFFSTIKSIFFKGLFAIFPLSATIFIINFIYKLFSHWLTPLKTLEPHFLQQIPGSEVVVMLLIIFCIGLLVQFLIIGPIIHYLERLITKIPLINSIYSAAKAIVDFFNISHEQAALRKVVLIHYPRKEYYNVAFLLGSARSYYHLLPEDSVKNEEYFRVFMPTSPTPGTGFFFILPQSEIIETSLSFEDAIKIIVSCGLITPEQATSLSTERKS